MAEIFKNLEKGFKEVFGFFKSNEEAGQEEKKMHSSSGQEFKSKTPREYRANDVKRLRRTLKCSQSSFAKLLNISIKTVQSWESGRRVPSQAALRLLQIFDDPRMRSLMFSPKKTFSKNP